MTLYEQDSHWMHVALAYGARAKGRTMPNPAVGCVIVKDNLLIAAAYTAHGGRPHAESQALEQAGEAARGATAYVTLEPCAHLGKTSPCAQALIDGGIVRVVIACGDPYTQVNGAGIHMLREAGIDVHVGLCEAQAAQQHRGFFKRERIGLPWVCLKVATSLDGCVANAKGESQWITGEPARNFGHHLRATHEVILTGIGTVLADDPSLTCRIAGLDAASPVRVVMDSHLKIMEDSVLLKGVDLYPLWIVTGAEYDKAKADRLREMGVVIHHVTTEKPSCEDVLRWLASQGVSSVLVEAGAILSTAMLESGFVDTLYWFRAPLVMGAGAKLAFLLDGGRSLQEMQRFLHLSTRKLGVDMLEEYTVNPLAHCGRGLG